MNRWLTICVIVFFLCLLSLVPLIQPEFSTMAAQQPLFVTVSAASYRTDAIAPESIVAGFGVNLSTETVVGRDSDANTPGIQLPTRLAGVS